jgi:hypothetical protein
VEIPTVMISNEDGRRLLILMSKYKYLTVMTIFKVVEKAYLGGAKRDSRPPVLHELLGCYKLQVFELVQPLL